MSKESMQEQLRQLLIAANLLTSDDFDKGIAEAKEELLEGQRTLQRESETPTLYQRRLHALREDVSALQRIADLSDQLSRDQLPMHLGTGISS
jgi:hypothetical protein